MEHMNHTLLLQKLNPKDNTIVVGKKRVIRNK